MIREEHSESHIELSVSSKHVEEILPKVESTELPRSEGGEVYISSDSEFSVENDLVQQEQSQPRFSAGAVCDAEEEKEVQADREASGEDGKGEESADEEEHFKEEEQDGEQDKEEEYKEEEQDAEQVDDDDQEYSIDPRLEQLTGSRRASLLGPTIKDRIISLSEATGTSIKAHLNDISAD